ncbi:MAG: tetratricopeptide repeat protein [Deltaproteobacteria bacterium]|nr:tetratricopeptide repeat protein [Deltaproteobacteria bacterium]
MNSSTKLVIAATALLLAMSAPALGEGNGSLMSVRDLSSHGAHVEALSTYEGKAESEITLADRLAAAKSAWAIGLPDRARKYWDEALSEGNFVGSERQRELLARSILELQEENYDEARARAERAAADLDASPMRAQFWLVVAEALKAQGAYSQAEGYYRRAVSEASLDAKNEMTYLLGECQLRLGLLDDARYSYTAVEASSKYSAQALRRLAEIDLSQRNYEGALTWIAEGRDNNPQEFDDPWVGYARVSALLQLERMRDAEQELDQLRVRHSEKEPWYILAEGEYLGRAGARARLANPANAIPTVRKQAQAEVRRGTSERY